MLRTFVEGVTVTADFTPDGWGYPSRKPERFAELEKVLRENLSNATSIAIGVRRITVDLALDITDTAENLSDHLNAVRAKVRWVVSQWRFQDTNELTAAG